MDHPNQSQLDTFNGFNLNVERSAPSPPAQDRVILVMGPPGVGKSTFIQSLTGQDTPSPESVGLDLHYFKRPGHQGICVVDIPGFGDAKRSDADVLVTVASWLTESYLQKIIPAGILFLHRITDIRMDEGSLKNIEMFRKLCGDDCLRNAILVTTMWSLVDPDRGQQREVDLHNTFWKPLIDRGSQVARFRDSQQSALEIVGLLDHKRPFPLLVQCQMIVEGKALGDTLAGTVVDAELERTIKGCKQAIADLRKGLDRNTRSGNYEFKKLAEEEIEKVKEDHSRAIARKHSLSQKWSSLIDNPTGAVAETPTGIAGHRDLESIGKEALRIGKRGAEALANLMHLEIRWD